MWMERLFIRLDELQNGSFSARKRPLDNGVAMIDNQEVCQMLQISKRTLQRYRHSGTLPFYLVYHKTWYKESEVLEFMKSHFAKNLAHQQERKKEQQ